MNTFPDIEYADCPACNGQGTVRTPSGLFDRDWVENCHFCDGYGVIPTDEAIQYNKDVEDIQRWT